MAKPTKIVVHFDDGTTTDIPAQGVGSIFMNENKAKKCGHNPPYGKPPHANPGNAGGNALASDASAGDTTMTAMADTCYLVNGIIVCP